MSEAQENTSIKPVLRLTFEGPRGPLFKALAEARKHFLSLTADATADVQLKGGGGYKHSYADLDTVIKALSPGWVAAELAVMQFIEGDDLTTVVGHGESSVSVRCPMPGWENPQQLGSASTYLRRYQLKAVFCVNDAEDDDGNAAAGNSAQVKRKENTPKAAPATGPKISDALKSEITGLAKEKELPAPEFHRLAQETCGKPWADFSDLDGKKFLAALVLK